MQTRQSGFTLIELIIVIVILGALAAVAVPRFVNLQDDAEQASLEGVAGGLASASAINFAGCSVANHSPGADCVQVGTCAGVEGAMQQDLDAKYAITAVGTESTTDGDSFECEVDDTESSTTTAVSFTAIAAGNS